MKKKILITICAIIVLGVGAFLIWTKCPFTKEDVSQPPVQEMEIQTGEKLQQETMASSSLWCDSPDINIGKYTIQPCNVGADEVGTGEKSYGNYYTWKEAQEVCPTGYHLPSKEEWQDLLDDYLISKWSDFINKDSYWRDMNNGIIKLEDFQNDLKLSLGGEKNYYFGFSIQEFMDTQGSIGTYWSSSPANSEIYAYALHVDPWSVYPQSYTYNDAGRAVRCFKD